MSSNEVCPYCGSAVERGSEFCQNCGASLNIVESTSSVRIISESQPSQSWQISQQSQPSQQSGFYTQPQVTVVTPARKQDDSQGTIALIFGILACVGILPCIGGIIAVIVGNNAKGSSNGSTGVTLGWISICLNIVAIIAISVSFFWWY
ncbi:MAG: zinc ribbon domain-containing protein [Candidatus Heimdallarchaeota archaeon]|nr:zinc ribbon domain-containing protein [Candidatus Heimdallarchaeota archaeon]MBY8994987.1 zinc ribbon domain-containing protein [Candidatus Heimdallarchaeota archaeon]